MSRSYTADTYDIHERTAHFMERRPISCASHIAVEAVYMVEVLTIVKSMKTMRKAEIAQRVQDNYTGPLSTLFLLNVSLTALSR